MNGLYSIIQYCPDATRGELVNVGLVLALGDLQRIEARTALNHDRVRRLFEVRGQELKNLQETESSLVARIQRAGPELSKFEALAQFARLRVNDLRMTAPRSIDLSDFDVDFERLFSELVNPPGHRQTSESRLRLRLSSLFRRFLDHPDVLRNPRIAVPVIGRTMELDYSYKSGSRRFVKVQSLAENRAAGEALRVLTEWDLIKKHPTDETSGSSLVVPLPLARDSQQDDERDRLAKLFGEYGVQTFFEEELDSFERQVERDLAHAS